MPFISGGRRGQSDEQNAYNEIDSDDARDRTAGKSALTLIQQQLQKRRQNLAAAEKLETMPTARGIRIKSASSTSTKIHSLTIVMRNKNAIFIADKLKENVAKAALNGQHPKHQLKQIDYEEVAAELEYQCFTTNKSIIVYRKSILQTVTEIKNLLVLHSALEEYVPEKRNEHGGGPADIKRKIKELEKQEAVLRSQQSTNGSSSFTSALDLHVKRNLKEPKHIKKDTMKQSNINSFFTKNVTEPGPSIAKQRSPSPVIKKEINDQDSDSNDTVIEEYVPYGRQQTENRQINEEMADGLQNDPMNDDASGEYYTERDEFYQIGEENPTAERDESETAEQKKSESAERKESESVERMESESAERDENNDENSNETIIIEKIIKKEQPDPEVGDIAPRHFSMFANDPVGNHRIKTEPIEETHHHSHPNPTADEHTTPFKTEIDSGEETEPDEPDEPTTTPQPIIKTEKHDNAEKRPNDVNAEQPLAKRIRVEDVDFPADFFDFGDLAAKDQNQMQMPDRASNLEDVPMDIEDPVEYGQAFNRSSVQNRSLTENRNKTDGNAEGGSSPKRQQDSPRSHYYRNENVENGYNNAEPSTSTGIRSPADRVLEWQRRSHFEHGKLQRRNSGEFHAGSLRNQDIDDVDEDVQQQIARDIAQNAPQPPLFAKQRSQPSPKAAAVPKSPLQSPQQSLPQPPSPPPSPTNYDDMNGFFGDDNDQEIYDDDDDIEYDINMKEIVEQQAKKEQMRRAKRIDELLKEFAELLNRNDERSEDRKAEVMKDLTQLQEDVSKDMQHEMAKNVREMERKQSETCSAFLQRLFENLDFVKIDESNALAPRAPSLNHSRPSSRQSASSSEKWNYYESFIGKPISNLKSEDKILIEQKLFKDAKRLEMKGQTSEIPETLAKRIKKEKEFYMLKVSQILRPYLTNGQINKAAYDILMTKSTETLFERNQTGKFIFWLFDLQSF